MSKRRKRRGRRGGIRRREKGRGRSGTGKMSGSMVKNEDKDQEKREEQRHGQQPTENKETKNRGLLTQSQMRMPRVIIKQVPLMSRPIIRIETVNVKKMKKLR